MDTIEEHQGVCSTPPCINLKHEEEKNHSQQDMSSDEEPMLDKFGVTY